MDRRQASKFSLYFPAWGFVPFFIFFTQIKKRRTLDPGQSKEEARPQNPDTSQGNSTSSSLKELKETLDLASAYVRIRGDAANSGQECGEALDSVLRRNLSRRLDSIVLVEEDSLSSISSPTIIDTRGKICSLGTEFVVPAVRHFLLRKSDIPSQVSSILRMRFPA